MWRNLPFLKNHGVVNDPPVGGVKYLGANQQFGIERANKGRQETINLIGGVKDNPHKGG